MRCIDDVVAREFAGSKPGLSHTCKDYDLDFSKGRT